MRTGSATPDTADPAVETTLASQSFPNSRSAHSVLMSGLRNSDHIPGVDHVGVRDDVRVGPDQPGVEVAVAVEVRGDRPQRVAGLDRVLLVDAVAGHDPWPVHHGHDDLVELRAVLGRDPEDLDVEPVEREGRTGHVDAHLELPVAARPVAGHEPADDLVVSLVDAVVELRLERSARGAGDLD